MARTLAALVVALTPTLGFAAVAHAGAAPALSLVSQDPWTIVGGDLHAKLDVQNAGPGSSISIVAHQAVSTREEFDQTLTNDDELGSVLDQVVVPLDPMPADADGNRDLTLGLEVSGGARLAERLGTRRAGVYPLEIELRDADDETQASFVTYLVAVAPLGDTGAVETALGVAWVWPLAAQPAILPGDGPDPAVLAELEPGGRLGRQAVALDRATGVPLTIVPGPETVQTWAAVAADDPTLADGVAALQRAAATQQVIGGPYVPIDMPSLLAAGMNLAVDRQLLDGEAALRKFFGTRVDPETAVARPIDSTSLGRLLTGGVDRLVVQTDALQDDEAVDDAQPFQLEPPPSLVPDTTTLSAVAADSDLARLLSEDGSAALKAQRVLAGLSVTAFALDETERVGAVTIMNPTDLDPSDALIDAMLAGLRANPLLHPMTVNEVFEQIPAATVDDAPATRELAPYSAPAPPVDPNAYESTRQRLASLQQFAPDAGGSAAADHALLASVSASWTGADGIARAASELASVEATISGFLSRIDVPNPSTITLTDRSGRIPLTFRNGTDQTVTVVIDLSSPKLSFPDGIQQVVELPPKSTTVRIAVESRTSGSFPLRVTVHSTDNVLTIAQAQLEVRATAVSAVGLVLIVSAAVFLALWWIVHIRRERIKRRALVPSEAT